MCVAVIHAGGIGNQSNGVGAGLGTGNMGPTDRDDDIFQVGLWGADQDQIIPLVDATTHALLTAQFPGNTNPKIGHVHALARRFICAHPEYDRVIVVPTGTKSASILEFRSGNQTGKPRNVGRTWLWPDMIRRLDVALAQTGAELVLTEGFQGEADVNIINDPNHEWYSLLPDGALSYREERLLIIEEYESLYGSHPIRLGGFVPSWLNGDAVKAAVVNANQWICNQATNRAFVATNNLEGNDIVDPQASDIHFWAGSQGQIASRIMATL